ncbi:ATPase [filamentous cyanobacterium CCT1]|nr:ATPase [filamentous cyanobacterium CCT1]PSN76988.1 ATPase [filamentous cyanobacterium CCP4]
MTVQDRQTQPLPLHRQALMAALIPIRRSLQQRIAARQTGEVASSETLAPPVVPPSDAASALGQLCQTFQLSPFEQGVVLLCAGVELDPTLRQLCAQAEPELKHGAPTFNLAGLVLAQGHWDAFVPASPLRHWQLIEVGASRQLMTAPLRIDERILHQLMGIPYLDERLTGLLRSVAMPEVSVPSHQEQIEAIVASWWQPGPARSLVQLCGADRDTKAAIATVACAQLGLSLFSLSTNALPTNPADLHQFLRLWEREAMLSNAALLLEWDDTHELDAARENAIALLIEAVTSPLLISSRNRQALPQQATLTLEIGSPTPSEQRHLWQTTLGDRAATLNGYVETLVSQFNLNASVIQAAGSQVHGYHALHQNDSGQRTDTDVRDLIWGVCRVQSRPQLDDLAQRIDPKEAWADLILPAQQKQMLLDLVAHVRQRSRVYEHWGFAGRSNRGLGISALFSGISGTGKTMAAGSIAHELKLDLYRIDLSSVVSKYIGETEKNLRRVFDAAEAGGVILLFDEADALFGKRSDVKDSHDRYANMEVSYLLQRMEAYRGLAILTTNLKEAIDPAFLRRIRFVVRFPFPEYGDRIAIWERIFPAQTPTQDLNFKKLAKLNLAGGNIRNIALNATFIAAEANSSAVTMEHLLKATQNEYLKLERQLTEAEVKGWV